MIQLLPAILGGLASGIIPGLMSGGGGESQAPPAPPAPQANPGFGPPMPSPMSTGLMTQQFAPPMLMDPMMGMAPPLPMGPAMGPAMGMLPQLPMDPMMGGMLPPLPMDPTMGMAPPLQMGPAMAPPLQMGPTIQEPVPEPPKEQPGLIDKIPVIGDIKQGIEGIPVIGDIAKGIGDIFGL